MVGLCFGEIDFEEFEVGVVQMRFNVRVFEGAILKRVEVIDTDDLVAVGEQAVERV